MPGTADPGNDSLSGELFSRAGPFTCFPLAEPDIVPAARIYTDVFLSDEPTSCRHAPDPGLFFPFAKIYVRSLVGKDLSFLAREKKTKRPAGFIFCFDLTHDPAGECAEMAAFISHFRDAVAMIDELEEHNLDRAGIRPGTTLHIFQIGVVREFRRMGLARALIRHAIAHAAERGFRQVVADCTNPASRQAFLAYGFAEKGFLSYEDFTLDGRKFFSGLDGGISLMVRNI